MTGALRAAAEAAGARVTLEAPVERVRVDGGADGVVLEDGREVGRAPCCRAPTRWPRRAWRARRRRRGGAGGAGGEGHAAARRAAGLPRLAGTEPWRGTIDIGFSLEDLAAAAADARAGRPAARAVDRGRVPDRRGPHARAAGRHVLSLFCQCFPPDVDAEAAADLAIARFARGLPRPARPDRRPPGARAHASSRRGSASPPGTSSTARCCPASCWRNASVPRRFGGMEGLYLAGSGAHPGGAVTGAPG